MLYTLQNDRHNKCSTNLSLYKVIKILLTTFLSTTHWQVDWIEEQVAPL